MHNHAFHTCRFKLEHALGLTRSHHLIGCLVCYVYPVDIKTIVFKSYHLDRIVYNGQRPQPEEVHLEQSQLLKRRHRILSDGRIIVERKRHIARHGVSCYNNTRRMGRGMSRHTLNLHRCINQTLYLVAAFIQ